MGIRQVATVPSLPLRIAILECDTPLIGTQTKYGGYGGVFKALLLAGASSMTPPIPASSLKLTSYDVVSAQVYPALADIDAILISGSRHNSYDNDPWIVKLVDFVKSILEQKRVKIIGVCFGHQIVGRAMGARVYKNDKGWEISVTAVDLTKRGQEIFGKTALALHQMHRDIVYDYPEGTELLAYTDKCRVQGMYISKRLITVQGHPEFTEDIVRELVEARHDSGLFSDEIYKDSIDRVNRYQDGPVVAKAFLRFLLEE